MAGAEEEYRFDLEDPAWPTFLKDEGYAVIKAAATPAEVAEAKTLLWKVRAPEILAQMPLFRAVFSWYRAAWGERSRSDALRALAAHPLSTDVLRSQSTYACIPYSAYSGMSCPTYLQC